MYSENALALSMQMCSNITAYSNRLSSACSVLTNNITIK